MLVRDPFGGDLNDGILPPTNERGEMKLFFQPFHAAQLFSFHVHGKTFHDQMQPHYQVAALSSSQVRWLSHTLYDPFHYLFSYTIK